MGIREKNSKAGIDSKIKRIKVEVENIKDLLLKQIKSNKWKIEIEDDYDDFKHFMAFKKDGLLEAFKRFDIVLIPLNGNTSSVEIRFLFYADPKVVGPDKRQFGKRVRGSNFKELRDFCEGIFKTAGIKAKEFAVSMSPKSRHEMDFGDGKYSMPAYEAELVYYT